MQPEVAEIIFITQQVEGENANNLSWMKEAKDRDCSGRSVSVQHQDIS